MHIQFEASVSGDMIAASAIGAATVLIPLLAVVAVSDMVCGGGFRAARGPLLGFGTAGAVVGAATSALGAPWWAACPTTIAASVAYCYFGAKWARR